MWRPTASPRFFYGLLECQRVMFLSLSAFLANTRGSIASRNHDGQYLRSWIPQPAPCFLFFYNQKYMIRFSTAGESHGEALVALVSGLPAGVPVDLDFVNRELWRRQQGYGRGGRMKIETDKAHVLSGVRHGKTIGSPIAIEIVNRDWKNWEEKLPG